MRWVWSRVAAAIAACSGVVAGLAVIVSYPLVWTGYTMSRG